MMPRLSLTGNILKGKTPFETATSKVTKDMLFPSDKDIRDIELVITSKGSSFKNHVQRLGSPENRAPNSRYQIFTQDARVDC